MGNIKFSIIMCTYNGGNRISDVVESVINQNGYNEYVKEFLIIDNNSNEETVEIINNNIIRDSRIKSIKELKQGLSYARLKGIENSNSEWIIFIDDDNILEANWIISTNNYIIENHTVGAFNGVVIPSIKEELSQEQKKILKNVLQGLACTDYSINNIRAVQKKHPYRIPFGAGLVIRAEPLKELAEKGWLLSKGRTSDNLTSCEDTEMCLYVKSKGFKFGYNNKMVIYHLIDVKRLDMEYLKRLWIGFADGNYNLIINSKYGKIKAKLYSYLLQYRRISSKIRVIKNKEYIVKYNLNTIYRERYMCRLKSI
ncbi:glycosyltransferase [Clostridium gasigenes]|uniref:Glycosyltransferase, GT2 family n=1 Tax=Clostridium gasigenes TaxID=94869 RepID=A0A1H0PNS7_9CLOT|nr:glycosyltransferase [Clostridium gasigenes]SDP06654.1 Glycosyltransferase, GT2 family [Clostridium gasigenes]